MFFCFILFVFSFIRFFSNKLLCLLFLEGIILSCVLGCASCLGLSFYPVLLMLIFSVFLVLDSVLGVSLIIIAGRTDSHSFSYF